jgi:hypothetical protein
MNHSIPEIPVIYFHSIAPKKHPYWVRNFLTLELHYFEAFLKYLKKHQWESIFLNEYYQIIRSGKKHKGKICCITFDDGFLDNFIYAFPLLTKYGQKGTIFVNPDFIDLKRNISNTLENDLSNNLFYDDKDKWGYLSWDELRLMQKSGIIDVQSHTLTHTKYYVSDELVSLHNPGDDCLYPVGNLFPERKPYYITDNEFEKLMPFGTPFFKADSAVIAKRIKINQDFNDQIIDMLKDFQWNQNQASEKAFEKIRDEYLFWKSKNKIIDAIETQDEYEKRLQDEIIQSKKIIEKELNKQVEFLCWPHGDNNEIIHQFALSVGYLGTTTGSKQQIIPSINRVSVRTSVGVVNNNLFLTNLKTSYRLSLARGNPYMKFVQKTVQKIKK